MLEKNKFRPHVCAGWKVKRSLKLLQLFLRGTAMYEPNIMASNNCWSILLCTKFCTNSWSKVWDISQHKWKLWLAGGIIGKFKESPKFNSDIFRYIFSLITLNICIKVNGNSSRKPIVSERDINIVLAKWIANGSSSRIYCIGFMNIWNHFKTFLKSHKFQPASDTGGKVRGS